MLNLKNTGTLKFVQKPAEHVDGSLNQSLKVSSKEHR